MTSAIKKTVVIGDCTLHLGNSLEIMPLLGMFDAVFTDPPYMGVKSNAWDNQWESKDAFFEWICCVVKAQKEILEFNGSLYWFCSPQMSSLVELAVGQSGFDILNNLVWDKSGARKGAGGSGVDVTSLRKYWSANTERIIFAEPSFSDGVAENIVGYTDKCDAAKSKIFGDYLQAEFKRAGVTNKQVAALFPSKTGGLTGCVSNWLNGNNVPTDIQYQTIRMFLGGAEYLKRDYEYLKRDYEDLRRPFNLNSSMEWGDIWRFPIARNTVHETQKPLVIMEHIIKSSSKSGGRILDPFMGSGTTGVACVKLGRKFTGIELDPDYFEISCDRIRKAYEQADLFVPAPSKPIAPVTLSLDLGEDAA